MTASELKPQVNYEEWLSRERRIRMKLLNDSPEIRQSKIYRVCRHCGEICLCHEESCPNCGTDQIVLQKIEDATVVSVERIRCRWRYDNLPREK